MAAAAILNLFESKIAALDPPSPKPSPYNQTWSGSDHQLQRYSHSRMLRAYGTPILGEGEVVGDQRSTIERAMVVSYRLFIVTVALSVPFGRNLRSNVSDAQINRGWVTLGPNLGVFPLEQIRHVGVAKSEHPRLTNGEINFEEFQPMWSQSTNVTDRGTDGQTDDMWSQYRTLHWSASRGKNTGNPTTV